MRHPYRAASTLLLVFVTTSPPARGDLIADSVADFRGVQGTGNWYYGYYAGTTDPPYSSDDFLLMSNFDGTRWQVEAGEFWTLLDPWGGHPNGEITSSGRQQVEQWSVRRWVSPIAGPIEISGRFADRDDRWGNGATAHLIVDGVSLWQMPIANGDRVGVEFRVLTNLVVGSSVDFAIDPTDSHDHSDTSLFTARLSTIPEPTSLALAGVALLALVGYSRYRRRWRRVSAARAGVH